MKKIGIIGLGLIGGSIFKALSAKGYEIVAVSNSMQGILPNITADYNSLKDCEVVFVCVAMNKTLGILDILEHILTPNTIVADVCSLKSFVCEKERPYIFIPTHPMAGTELRGFENSFAELFEGAKWVITPKFTQERIDELKSLIFEMGAQIVTTTPQKHDEAVALISHMPMVLAQGLFLAASENPLAMEIAASGFRDMTRLAMSNEEMACDMVNMNAENIQNAILKLYKSLGELTSENYPNIIANIKAERQKMFVKK